ncbi:MAG: hypothetical protein K8R44_02110 [Sulfurimonas sp.]|nr:hypothetical protein [Sulfurimonas sp.]
MKIKTIKSKDLVDILKVTSLKKVIVGYSNDARNLINCYDLNIDYIVDKNKKLKVNKLISYKEFYKLSNSIVILCGNHIQEILLDFYMNNISSQVLIIVDFARLDRYANQCHFTIDAPHFNNKSNKESQQIFIEKVSRVLINNNIGFNINPDIGHQLDMFENLSIKNDELLLSYHTRGKSSKNIIRYKNSYLKDYIIVDKEGYSGWHSYTKSLTTKKIDSVCINNANKFYKKLFQDNVKDSKSFYAQTIIDFKFPDKYIFSFASLFR